MFLIGRLKHVFLVIAVLFAAVFFRWTGRASILETAVYWANGRIVSITQSTLLPYGGAEKTKKKLLEVERERTRLVKRLAAAEEEIERLRLEMGIRNYYRREADEGLTGRIIGRSPSTWNNEIVVDVGSREGVKVNFIALAGGGVAGRVVHATPESCVVRLITGRGSAVSAMAAGTSSYGIVTGNGTGRLVLGSIPSHAKIMKGDLVVTSGLGGVYPPNLPIGRVSRVVRREDRLSPLVELVSSADLDDIHYVMLFEP